MKETLNGFAKFLYTLLKSDRDVTIGVGGFTGEGKSCFSTALAKEYSKVSKTDWNFNYLTWSRKELFTWIDGKNKNDKGGQVPEYTCLLPDELFTMFYKRNWYEEQQKDSIAILNMCRDRHLLLIGNIPNFWDLDGGFQSRVRFYVYISQRGKAWVFEQENNPFSSDNWNVNENKKIFRKAKKPYKCPNYVCEIEFPDWSKEEKEEYYSIRNEKRLEAIDVNKSDKVERYSKIKAQRDILIKMLLIKDKEITQKALGELLDLDKSTISYIVNGLR